MHVVKRKMSKKHINNMKIILSHSMNSSFFLAVFLRIIFFPYFIMRRYFRFMLEKPLKFIIFNIILIAIFLMYLFVCYLTLPNIDKVSNYRPLLTSKFYDDNGDLIYELGSEKRTHIDINMVPKMLINAFISAEDKTFYSNSGFDPVGLTRTAIQDVVKLIRRQKLGGASTITQQVVKNVLLTNKRTITRKVKELILSYRLSKLLSKDAIMEIYLNHIYLGMQAYGIVSASEEYFGKSVSQLTIPEMALLAAMPKAPSSINPFRNYNRAVARRNWVLSRMCEDGYITQDQYEQYSKTELVVHKRHNTYAPFYAPAFFAQSLLMSKEVGMKKENLLNDGYKVQLTIDGDLQKIAQNALNHSLENYSKKHGYIGPMYAFTEEEVATKTSGELLRMVDEPENLNRFSLAVVLKVDDKYVEIGLNDNSKGIILLNDMLWARQKISEIEVSEKNITKCNDVLNVGDVIVVAKKTDDSKYYTLEQLPQINGGVIAMDPKTGAVLAMVGGYADIPGSFNRTTQAFRQMGSTIKPFVYGSALENGFTPASIFMDTDISMNIGNGITWNPANDNKKTNGPTTLRIGLEKSKNTVTIRIAEAVGLKKIRQKIIQSGLNSKPENNFSVAIGSVESSLVNIATAYSAFANGGIMPQPYLIRYVKNIIDKRKNDEEPNDSDENNTQGKSSELLFNKIYFKDCKQKTQCKVDLEIEENNEINDENLGKKEYIKDDDDKVLNENNGVNNNNENDNTDLKSKQENERRIFSPEVAYQVTNILQGAVRRGTSYKLNALGLPIASKTGTSNDGKDLWNIIISPELVLVTYVGYDSPMETGNFGSQFALPVNKEILLNLPEKYKISDFKTPEGIKFVKINRLTGKAIDKSHEDEDNVIFEAFKSGDEVVSIGQSNADEDSETMDLTDL